MEFFFTIYKFLLDFYTVSRQQLNEKKKKTFHYPKNHSSRLRKNNDQELEGISLTIRCFSSAHGNYYLMQFKNNFKCLIKFIAKMI